MKTCTVCSIPKPLSEFQEDKSCKSGYSNKCKQCHKSRRHNARLIRQFGITLEQYAAILKAQGGVCACCGDPETVVSRGGKVADSFCVDHDHSTGLPRSLLCRRCNSVIGMAREDTTLLHGLIDYLSFWRQQHNG